MGAVKLECAARIYDRVEHSRSFLGALAGFLVGLAVGIFLVAAVVSTGGLAAVALVASAALLGSSIGEFVGGLIKHDAGDIKTGALTVFVGGYDRRAARVDDKLECHDGEIIVSGCKTIFIEGGLNAARVTEETSCDGKIKDGSGCPTVKYGGDSVTVRPKRFSGELPGWFYWGREAVGLVAMVAGWKAIFKDWGKYGRWLKAYFVGSTAFSVVDKGLNVTAGIAHHVENTGLENAIKAIRGNFFYKLTSTAFWAIGAGRKFKLGWREFGRGKKVYEGANTGLDGAGKVLDLGESGALLFGDQNLAGHIGSIKKNPYFQAVNLTADAVGFGATVKSQMPKPVSPIIQPVQTPIYEAQPIIAPPKGIVQVQQPLPQSLANQAWKQQGSLLVPDNTIVTPKLWTPTQQPITIVDSKSLTQYTFPGGP